MACPPEGKLSRGQDKLGHRQFYRINTLTILFQNRVRIICHIYTFLFNVLFAYFSKRLTYSLSTTKPQLYISFTDKSKGNSQYPYPAEFQPSNTVTAILSEYEPTPQGFYDTVLAGIIGSKKEMHISQIAPSVRYASERSQSSSLKNRKGGLETISNDLSKTQKETCGKHPIVPSPKMPATRGLNRGAASKIASPLTRKTDSQQELCQCVGNMSSPKTTGSKIVMLNSTSEEKKGKEKTESNIQQDHLKKTNLKS